MLINAIKWLWKCVNSLHPETRSLIIIVLFGCVLYSQITESTANLIKEKFQEEVEYNKKAEEYSMTTSIELNHQIQLISEKDQNASTVLLLNYHNNTQSLQGYKYLYLSCLTEAQKCLDCPSILQQWNRIDYIYYADELAKIHRQECLQINDIDEMPNQFPKLYRLVKGNDIGSLAFYTIEGQNSAIGMVVVFYKEKNQCNKNPYKLILPHIQKLAILLDYDNSQK